MTRLLLSCAVAALRLANLPLRLRRQRDLAVLISRQYSHPSADFARIRDTLADLSPATDVVLLMHRSTGRPWTEAGRLFVQMWHLAAARFVIVDTYIIPVSVLRRHGVPVVQIWHAIGAIKRFGWASVGTAEGSSPAVARAMRMHAGYTAVAVGGPDAAVTFAQGFGVAAATVKATGQPRHDALVDAAELAAGREHVAGLYPEVLRERAARPIVFYAPTMRRGVPVDVAALAALIGERYQLVISPHPLDTLTQIPQGAVDGRKATSAQWLAIASHVVTDYSAVAFEAVALGVPTWFVPYDAEEYAQSPGLFVDPRTDLPAVTGDAATVVSLIAAYDAAPEAASAARATWERLRAGYAAAADGGATRRVLELCGITAAPPAQ